MKALSKLRNECEKAKPALSSTTQIKIEIDNLADGYDFSKMYDLYLLTHTAFEIEMMCLYTKYLEPVLKS